MPRGDLENLRRALASGPPALLALLDDDVQWDYVGAFPEAVTYHGPQEVEGFLREWAGGFDDFGFEAEETIEAGDSVVVGLHQWGREGDRRAGGEPHLAGVQLPGRQDRELPRLSHQGGSAHGSIRSRLIARTTSRAASSAPVAFRCTPSLWRTRTRLPPILIDLR